MDNHKRDSDKTAQQLIDIFYKDTYRLDSIISQINNGALQSVTTKTDKTQSSVSDLGGSVGLTQLLSASGKNTSSESVGKHIEETRKIGDDLLIQLIRQLNITPQSNNFTKVFSYLNIISGTINLKNFKLIAQMIPLLKDGMDIFDHNIAKKNTLEYMINFIKTKSSKTSDDKKKLKELENALYATELEAMPNKAIFNNLHAILPFLPTGIGFEVSTDDGTLFTGTLKSKYLIDSEETISLNYGARLPGKWNILGIIDYKENSDAEPNENDIIAMLHKSMNQIAGALINSTSKATIIPIMIYRNLCHNYL